MEADITELPSFGSFVSNMWMGGMRSGDANVNPKQLETLQQSMNQTVIQAVDNSKLELMQQIATLKKELDEKAARLEKYGKILETKIGIQLQAVDSFLKTKIRQNANSKIYATTMNEQIAMYAMMNGVFIEPWEVPKLLQNFGLKAAKSNGETFYRGYEPVG